MRKIILMLLILVSFAAISQEKDLDINLWIEALSHPSPQMRMQAIEILGEMGEKAAPAIPHVVLLINSTESYTLAVRYELSRKNILFHEAYPLRTKICYNAAVALGKIAKKDIPTLIEAMKSPCDFRESAEITFTQIGAPVIPYLEKYVNDPAYRWSVRKILAKLGRLPLSIVIKETSDPNREIRKAAIADLGNAGEQAPDVLPYLINALADKNPRIRWAAAMALEKIGGKAAPATIHLLYALSDEAYDESMGQGGPRKKFYYVHDAAEMALECIGEKAVPALIEAVSHKDLQIRLTAIGRLGAIGEKAKTARPYLTKLLSDPYPEIRAAAQNALGNLNPPPELSLPSFLDKISAYGYRSRLRAIETMPRETTRKATYLLKALENNFPLVRKIAREELIQLGNKAIPQLMDTLCQSPEGQAGHILAEIGDEAIPYLIPKLATRDKLLKKAVVDALTEIGHKRILPHLLAALKEPHPLKRSEFVLAVGDLYAIRAVPALIQALLDYSEDVRVNANKSLKQIGLYGFPYLEKSLQDPALAKAHPEITKIIEEIKSEAKKQGK